MSGPESHMQLGEDFNISIERFEDFSNEENGLIEGEFEKAKAGQFEQVVSARGKLLGANTEWLQKNDPKLAA